MRSVLGVSLVIFLLFCQSSFAACTLNEYDTTPPTAVTDDVIDTDGQFKWSSDLDRINDMGRVWNYIHNTHATNSLNAKWSKAGIRIEFANPLPAGAIFCNKYWLKSVSDSDIDDEAPIIFGNNNREQRAVVYRKVETTSNEPEHFKSLIESTYVDDSGKPQEISVEFFYSVDDNKISQMGIIASEGIYVGFPGVQAFWSDATLKSMAGVAKDKKTLITFATLSEFSKDWENSQYFANDESLANKFAVVTTGTLKDFGLNLVSASNTVGELVVFDAQRRPIASGFVTIPIVK